MSWTDRCLYTTLPTAAIAMVITCFVLLALAFTYSKHSIIFCAASLVAGLGAGAMTIYFRRLAQQLSRVADDQLSPAKENEADRQSIPPHPAHGGVQQEGRTLVVSHQYP